MHDLLKPDKKNIYIFILSPLVLVDFSLSNYKKRNNIWTEMISNSNLRSIKYETSLRRMICCPVVNIISPYYLQGNYIIYKL